MSAEPQLFEDPPQPWVRPTSKFKCRRDPDAGPGTCWYWYEGCPNAEKRNCYSLWLKGQEPDLAAIDAQD